MRLALIRHNCLMFRSLAYYVLVNKSGGNMGKGFEEQAHNEACLVMGEALWQLIANDIPVTRDAIASMVVTLSERRPDIAESIALSVLRQA